MALTSKFEKKSKPILKATKVFTDRHSARTVFRTSLETLQIKPREIMVFYGIGGVGKSKLIGELRSVLKESPIGKKMNSAFVSLDAYDYSNFSNILLSIRSQLKYNCHLFDYAYLQYCQKAEISVSDIKERTEKIDSPIIGIVNEALDLGFGSVSIPTTLLSKAMEFAKEMAFRHRNKELITELQSLNEGEILERLPYYLGLCISEAAEREKYTTIFIDSYENNIYSNICATDPEEWVKELFLSSESLRLIIASRDKLKWYKEDEEWNTFLNQHLLEHLSPQDCEYYLRSVPIKEENVIKSIAASSQGLPLYLDMSVDIYENKINNGEPIGNEEFSFDGAKLLKRYLKCFSNNEKMALEFLCYFDFFTEAFAVAFLKKLGISMYKDELAIFLERSIFIKDEENGTYRVDNTIRSAMIREEDENDKNVVLTAILKMADDAVQVKDFYLYFLQTLNVLNGMTACKHKYVDMVLGNIVEYINAGKWAEVQNYLARFSESQNPHIGVICYFANLLFVKRTGNLKNALAVAEAAPEFTSQYQKALFDFVAATIKHLLGQYEFAFGEYKRIMELSLLDDGTAFHNLYVDSATKYADLLFLKGMFPAALEVLDELIKDGRVPAGEKIEIIRTKGHIYRFNLMGEKAENCYRAAMNMAQDENNGAQIAKLYTNFAENNCGWNPEKAKEFGQKSQELNTELGNYIEVGKSLCALALAKHSLGEADAMPCALRAREICQKETGYKAGELFALAAMATIEKKEEVLAEMESIAAELGVYGFLVDLTKGMVCKKESIILNSAYQWLDREGLAKTMNEQA